MLLSLLICMGIIVAALMAVAVLEIIVFAYMFVTGFFDDEDDEDELWG